MEKYLMKIRPALKVTERHRLEDCLKKLGYHVSGGGQMVDGSVCDISFDDETIDTHAETEQIGESEPSIESFERKILFWKREARFTDAALIKAEVEIGRLEKEVEQYKQVLKEYNLGV